MENSPRKMRLFLNITLIAILIMVRHKVSGFREQGTGNREQGTGNKEFK
jgi:hypothetical protein